MNPSPPTVKNAYLSSIFRSTAVNNDEAPILISPMESHTRTLSPRPVSISTSRPVPITQFPLFDRNGSRLTPTQDGSRFFQEVEKTFIGLAGLESAAASIRSFSASRLSVAAMPRLAGVELLARRLADHERFRDALAGDRLGMIVKAAPLHDLGKVGIPDGILLKPGKLTDEEFEIMKHHATIGADAIGKAMAQASASAGADAAESASRAFQFLGVARVSVSPYWNRASLATGVCGWPPPATA